MSLMDAPAYDGRSERMIYRVLIGIVGTVTLLFVLAVAGYVSGHGWLWSNLPSERYVDKFLTAVEQQRWDDAYGYYVADPKWKDHPEKYKDYPLDRFKADWTTYSPVGEVIRSHKVEKAVADGSGLFGTTILVASSINGDPQKRLFIARLRSDGSLTYPAPHIFLY